MQVSLNSAALFLVIFLAGAGSLTVSSSSSSSAAGTNSNQTEPTTLGTQANALFRGGEYSRAAGLYQEGYRQSIRSGDIRLAIRRLNNLAGCRFALFEYPSAMEAYLETRRLAESASDYEVQGTVSLNIASLYLQMNDPDSAALAAGQGLAVMFGHRRADFPVSQLLTLLGRIRSRQGRIQEAERAYRAAIEEAMAKGDAAQTARSWDAFGYSRLRAGDLEQAEASLIEAYRLRLLLHIKDIHLSYLKLALLRLAQNDLAAADVLSARSLELAAGSTSGSPLWHVYLTRGLVEEARGELSAAFGSFGRAIEDARRWRLGVLPADALRATSDEALSTIYSGFVRAGARLYFQTGRRELISRTFEVMEQSRAASLRESSGGGRDWRTQLPAEYGATLARLRSAEAELMRRDSPVQRATARDARLRLLDLETRAGLEVSLPNGRPAGGGSLAGIQQSLRPEEALISFLVDQKESFAWTVTRSSASLSRLAGRERLAGLVQATADQVRSGAEAHPAGGQLARELFLQNKAKLGLSPRWLIELDDVLFRVPVAALPDPTAGPGGGYIVERHSVEVVPSVLMRAVRQPSGAPALFVGVGDPIYNSADPRFRRPERRERFAGWMLPWLRAASAEPAAGLELPRLAGSGQEIRRGSASWTPLETSRVILLGEQATREDLARALERHPSILHFATHVLKSSLRTDEAMIALSLGQLGEARFLDSPGIRLLDVPGAVVVLSGCSTGAGQILRGAGLMGLTRSWLLAGARSVVASHWPTPDDSGEFFIAFYRFLRAEPGDVASALRRAQLEMLRSGSWRSQPSYWAAYFTYGKH
ncbi:MAG: CHAT domain-containing protein [Acidobacteria bacterium]|nr:CHAT domain-containing protein [Acidobacteriota bacterium]